MASAQKQIRKEGDSLAQAEASAHSSNRNDTHREGELRLNNSDRTGRDSRKQAVSIRMNRSDVRNIKRLAERLGARDSDVIRFAIKLMLSRLALLQDVTVRGRGLVPVFLESGPELIRHFELDFAKLSSIINEGAEPGRDVDADDIQLLALHGLQRSYLKLRVAGLRRAQAAQHGNGMTYNGHAGGNGAQSIQTAHTPAASDSGSGNGGTARSNGHAAVEEDGVEQSLRQYLYDKYLDADPSASQGPG